MFNTMPRRLSAAIRAWGPLAVLREGLAWIIRRALGWLIG